MAICSVDFEGRTSNQLIEPDIYFSSLVSAVGASKIGFSRHFLEFITATNDFEKNDIFKQFYGPIMTS